MLCWNIVVSFWTLQNYMKYHFAQVPHHLRVKQYTSHDSLKTAFVQGYMKAFV